MSSRTRETDISYPRLVFKISFFQDVFTIIEELTGDCPEVGLPEGFRIEKKIYRLFHNLQRKYKLTKIFITNFNNLKKLKEWDKIKEVTDLYKKYWVVQKLKLFRTLNYLKSAIDFEQFIKKLESVTNTKWDSDQLDVFLTIGYKDSGTYDREINVIRLGIHEKNKEYLVYTLYHELIHYHIIKHMKIKLKEDEEEVLCRAIFKLIFQHDLIAQQHWKEHLTDLEIERIEKKAKKI